MAHQEGVSRWMEELASAVPVLSEAQRRVLARTISEVETAYGTVRVKSAENGGFAPEFDDCRRIAKEKRVPLRTVIAEANEAFRQRTRS